MSFITPSHLSSLPTNTKKVTSSIKKHRRIGLLLTMATLVVSVTGCSTTQEFKPTASVIVGAHKSL